MTVYIVSPLAQVELVYSLCFDKCGQVNIGAIELMGGVFLPCRHSPCPYLDKEASLGQGFTGRVTEEIVVRKLKDAK